MVDRISEKVEEAEAMNGICANCRQNKEVERFAESNILICKGCSPQVGKKVMAIASVYFPLENMSRDYYVQELIETHYKIHEAWTQMQTPSYAIFHFLVLKEILRLGQDIKICPEDSELFKHFLTYGSNVARIMEEQKLWREDHGEDATYSYPEDSDVQSDIHEEVRG